MDDNNQDFDRFNHDDYDEQGFRKPMGSKTYYDEDGNKVQGYGIDLSATRGAKYAVLFFVIILVVVFYFGPKFNLFSSSDYRERVNSCTEKAEKHLKEKYNIQNASLAANTYNKENTSFCDFSVKANDKEFKLVFTLDDNSKFYDSYQMNDVIKSIANEISQYDVQVVNVDAKSDYLANEKFLYRDVLTEKFKGTNYKEIFTGFDVKVYVVGDMKEDIFKFASIYNITNITFISFKDKETYEKNKTVSDIDYSSLYIDKVIEIKNNNINKYKFDTVDIDGVNIVFKGLVYNLEEEPILNKTSDGCTEITYKGYKDPGDGIFRGNIINMFGSTEQIVSINGTDYALEKCGLSTCHTKIGVANGTIKICVKEKDV